MNPKHLPRELIGVLISALFIALGLAALWGAKTMVVTLGDTVTMTLLLMPILIYFIATGRLSEFKAGGVLEAKFREVAEQPTIQLGSDRIAVVEEDMKVVPKAGVHELQRLEALLDGSKRIVLTLILGKHRYVLEDAKIYLERFLVYRNFSFVAFVDGNNKVVGYMNAWALYRVLNGDQGGRFIELLNESRASELLAFPGVITQVLTTTDTNADALRKMTTQNLDAMIVVDEKRQLKGVIEREQILSKMMVAMVQ
jgi:CBS domain-containing protein